MLPSEIPELVRSPFHHQPFVPVKAAGGMTRSARTVLLNTAMLAIKPPNTLAPFHEPSVMLVGLPYPFASAAWVPAAPAVPAPVPTEDSRRVERAPATDTDPQFVLVQS